MAGNESLTSHIQAQTMSAIRLQPKKGINACDSRANLVLFDTIAINVSGSLATDQSLLWSLTESLLDIPAVPCTTAIFLFPIIGTDSVTAMFSIPASVPLSAAVHQLLLPNERLAITQITMLLS